MTDFRHGLPRRKKGENRSMALAGSMSAGISAMKAHMDALTVVGNNVANVNTYGYKPGRVTFKESIYSTQAAGSDGTETLGGTNPRQTGYGCSVGTIDLDMSTVNMESTGNARDAGIQGDGFFLLGDKNGVVSRCRTEGRRNIVSFPESKWEFCRG